MQTMICTKCGRSKSITEFRRDKGRNDGYHPWCKKCHCVCEKERRKRTPPPDTKICTKCGEEKPCDSFGKKRRGKGKYRQLRQTCKECSKFLKKDRLRQKREAQQRYKEKNRELIKDNKKREYTRNAAIWKEKIEELKSLAIGMKGGACAKCGLALCKENPSFCFDFHHRDPSLKRDSPGRLLTRAARSVESQKRKEEFFDEIKDCDVLCAVCHRKVHYEMGAISDNSV